MRCCYCDFSPDTPSEFHMGLHLPQRANKRLRKDKRRGTYVCSECWDVVDEIYKDLDFRSNDAMDFDAPTVSVWEEQ